METVKNFCQVHGMWESNSVQKYWVELGMNYGFLEMCDKAKTERESQGWKITPKGK